MVAVLGVAASLTLALTAAPRAQAMAMYNSSTYYEGGTSVRFICGTFCGWFSKGLGFHETISYPGKGGSFNLIQVGCIMSSDAPNIENHGFAELIGASLNSSHNGIGWNMWGNNEKGISGSPFPVICEPEPGSRIASRAGGAAWVVKRFRAWDGNEDGRLSAGELRAGIMRDFRAVDLNSDGVINRRDIRIDLRKAPRAARGRSAQAVLAFDLNRDGRVHPAEYRRYVQRSFVDPMTQGRGNSVTLGQVKAFYAGLK